MHPVQSVGYAAAYPAYPLNPPLSPARLDWRRSVVASRRGRPTGLAILSVHSVTIAGDADRLTECDLVARHHRVLAPRGRQVR